MLASNSTGPARRPTGSGRRSDSAEHELAWRGDDRFVVAFAFSV